MSSWWAVLVALGLAVFALHAVLPTPSPRLVAVIIAVVFFAVAAILASPVVS